jgi:hypothetical protein
MGEAGVLAGASFLPDRSGGRVDRSGGSGVRTDPQADPLRKSLKEIVWNPKGYPLKHIGQSTDLKSKVEMASPCHLRRYVYLYLSLSLYIYIYINI